MASSTKPGIVFLIGLSGGLLIRSSLVTKWSSGETIKALPLTLNGCFEGLAQLQSPVDHWNVNMFFQIESGKTGVAMITLSSKGKVISRNRSRGEMNNFRGIPNDPQAMLMEADPENVFQMYYIPTMEQWVANIYAKQKNDTYQYRGHLSLHRGSTCERPF